MDAASTGPVHCRQAQKQHSWDALPSPLKKGNSYQLRLVLSVPLIMQVTMKVHATEDSASIAKLYIHPHAQQNKKNGEERSLKRNNAIMLFIQSHFSLARNLQWIPSLCIL